MFLSLFLGLVGYILNNGGLYADLTKYCKCIWKKKKDRFLVYLMEILQIIQTNSLENAEQKKKIKEFHWCT